MSPTAPKPIAYVQASWHTHVTDHCKHAFKEHMRTKGKELAEACVSIIESLSAVDALS